MRLTTEIFGSKILILLNNALIQIKVNFTLNILIKK